MSELKNQELPPLDLTEVDREMTSHDYANQYSATGKLHCRERQLRAALNELKAKDTELASLKQVILKLLDEACTEHDNFERQLRAKDARIAELERDKVRIFDMCSDYRAKLGAVSEVLKEKLEVVFPDDIGLPCYRKDDVDNLLTKARSIVEGK